MHRALSVVVPVHNEVDSIEETIREIIDNAPRSWLLQIVIVDDASTDGTGLVIDGLHRSMPCEITIITRQEQGGLGGALLTGFDSATGEIITWIPGDGEYRMKDLVHGLALLNDVQIVLVRRAGCTQRYRGLVSAAMHLLIRLLFHIDLRHFCGIFFMRRTDWLNLQVHSSSAFFALDVAINANRQSLTRAWITAPWIPRQAGQSSVFRIRVLRASLMELIRLRTQ